MTIRKGGLGKGLDAIFVDNESESQNENIKIKISEIEPNRNQPRKNFNDQSLAELADSISKHGVIQPILVRPLPDGGYQIVSGERRWRASRMVGINEIPVLIKELTDHQVMEIALIENLQRQDLSIIEEAQGYKVLMETYGLTQDEVSKSVGKSRPSITNTIRILNLPDNIIQMLKDEKITAGHARAILSLESEEEMQKIAQIIVNKNLSLRQAEKLAKISEQNKKNKKNSKKRRDSFFDEVEISLHEYLGRKVKVSNSTKGKGTLTLEFYNKEDLAEIAKKLGDD